MGAWWASGVENGHWRIVVSTEELGLVYDPWGYKWGELNPAILAEVPFGPDVITTAAITLRLNKDGGAPSPTFAKAVRQKLARFRKEGLIKAAQLGGPLLGWYRP